MNLNWTHWLAALVGFSWGALLVSLATSRALSGMCSSLTRVIERAQAEKDDDESDWWKTGGHSHGDGGN